ncbi:G patch domain-containing protein 4 [Etheostoma spectabile]|uniref:G patch domain-containing protein 4 n=1 Tax=Etheostoma spectabile TaxID=54343 RepID=UPI0013AECE81|nr:G patch domain-containing protein 4 [Etheostoma spectabile]
MAGAVPEKSRALKFAEQQLLRHGWEHGKGLGRGENGISEAIKVKVKCGKGGVGHKEGEQFTFHWWDHVFNKASSGLQVESDQNGIQLKKTMEKDEDEGMISNKKPRKATLAKAKLYGCFVKSATLLSGQEQPELKSSSSDDSSGSEEEDQKLDLSSTTKLSDADLMKACGGRTAHKGARHGLTMSAKLARLEQQEAEFMAKYGKKSQPVSAPTLGVTLASTTSPSTDQRAERQEETVEDSQKKKMKKKRSKSVHEQNGDEGSERPGSDVKPHKKKEKKASEDTEGITDAVSTEGDLVCVENKEADNSHKTKRKHKKKKNNAEQNKEERTPSPESKSPEETAELHTDTKVKKNKKKSSKHRSEPAEEEESYVTESSQSELVQDCVPKTKKKKAAVTLEESEVPEEESTVKQKRKKCKKDKPSVEDNTNEEALPPKKKKKKMSKE